MDDDDDLLLLQDPRLDQESFANKILSSFAKSDFDKPPQEYLPEACVMQIATRDAIGQELSKKIDEIEQSGRNVQKYDKSFQDRLSHWIHEEASKVFIITFQCQPEAIKLLLSLIVFHKHGFDDNSLPISDPSDIPPSEMEFDPRIWSPFQLKTFHENQWKCLVPVFSPNKYQYNLPPKCIFPFTSAVDAPKAGAFGTVYHVKVHPDHQKHRVEDVAIKEIKVSRGNKGIQTDNAWEVEARLLELINKIDHPHILRCIAAIRRGSSRYFMFPWADGDSLRDFWKHTPKQAPGQELILQTLHQLRGLADALDQLHNASLWDAMPNQTVQNSSTVAQTTIDVSRIEVNNRHGEKHNAANGGIRRPYWHGDLKPENILRFSVDTTPLGVLKIADMGLAKRHVAATRTKSRLTSIRLDNIRYEAPEAVDGHEPLSHLADVWSLGCITLEFIIWILYGNDGLKKFHNEQNSEIIENKTARRVEVHKVAFRWMDQILPTNPQCSQNSAIGDLLNIVRNKLLVVSLPPRRPSSHESGHMLPAPRMVGVSTVRATAQEFRDALDKVLSKANQPGYLLVGNPRSEAKPMAHSLHDAAAKHRVEGVATTKTEDESELGRDETSILLLDDPYRPLLRRDTGPDFLKCMPPAIVVASSEPDAIGLEMAALKIPSNEYINVLEKVANMFGARDEGCFLPPEVIRVQDSDVHIMQAPFGVAIHGREVDLRNLVAYWGILTASSSPFHDQPLDWYLKEMRPIDGFEHTQFTMNDMDNWKLDGKVFDSLSKIPTQGLQSTDDLTDQNCSSVYLEDHPQYAENLSVERRDKSQALDRYLVSQSTTFSVTDPIFGHKQFPLVEGASCWTQILNIRSIFTINETIQSLVDLSEGGLDLAKTSHPGALLIQTPHLFKIFPETTVGVRMIDPGDEKLFVETRRGTVVLESADDKGVARGHVLDWEDMEDAQHVEESDSTDASLKPKSDENMTTGTNSSHGITQTDWMIEVLPGNNVEQEEELSTNGSENISNLPQLILLGTGNPAKGQARYHPSLHCHTHNLGSGLPGVPNMMKPKSRAIQGSLGASYFATATVTVATTSEFVDPWVTLGTFGDCVDELLGQAVILVNHDLKHAVATTGLHAALSFEKGLFQGSDALQLDKLVTGGDSQDMRRWTKNRLRESPPLACTETLKKNLEWYSKAFRKLSVEIVQPKSKGTCYGAEAKSLQSKSDPIIIYETQPNKLVRHTWRPASGEEGPVIFLDPQCLLFAGGNTLPSAWVVATIPSAMKQLERHPRVSGRSEVRLRWSALRSTTLSCEDPDTHVYHLEKKKVVYAMRETVPEWALERCGKVVYLG